LDDDVQLEEVIDSNVMNKSLMQIYKKSAELPAKRKSDIKTAQNKKSKADNVKWPAPTCKLSDLGGVEHISNDLMQLIGVPLKYPEIYQHLGIDPPRGILLHGPPGCGKTALAHAIAGEAGVPFINIAAPVIVSGMSGESEKKIREVFEEAKELAPCILFIDEIDSITPKRETAQREMERRIVAQLLTCMDSISLEKTDFKPVIIIGATNRPDSLDPALRRAGRFDREIAIGVPDEKARQRILEKICSKLQLDGCLDYNSLAKLTPGYVGADLNALVSEAGMIAVSRIFKSLISARCNEEGQEDGMIVDKVESLGLSNSPNPNLMTLLLSSERGPLNPTELASISIRYQDFVDASKIVQPSSKREGFATVPDVSWDQIGALKSIQQELRMAIVEPIRHPEFFESVGITSSMGVLLYGPPGCGKTLLAKAVANESHSNFLSVKGPELLNKYVGESERAIRMVFARAQASSPCIIFFDELDALCPARSNDAESQSSSRLVNTLLTEMDGMQGRKQVFVIAATNRPDMIDPAMLRPGRLDKALYVDLPNCEERHDILKTITKKTPMATDVSLEKISKDPKCEGMSGADLAALVREASVMALKGVFLQKDIQKKVYVCQVDFENALKKVTSSVTKRVL
jgi:ribosome biogenesis ATPase